MYKFNLIYIYIWKRMVGMSKTAGEFPGMSTLSVSSIFSSLLHLEVIYRILHTPIGASIFQNMVLIWNF